MSVFSQFLVLILVEGYLSPHTNFICYTTLYFILMFKWGKVKLTAKALAKNISKNISKTLLAKTLE